MTTLDTTLQVWADILCPWCWMGHRRLTRAIEQSGTSVTVQHRSFLLAPQGPVTTRRRIGEVAVTEWGLDAGEWASRRDRIEHAGRADGLSIQIDSALAIDSREAHRVLKLVAARGLDAAAVWDAMFAAHLERNVNLQDWAELTSIGVEAGLGRQEVLALAESGDFTAEVLADHQEARSRGIHTVPTVVHGERHLSGARSVSELAAFVLSAASEAVA